MPIWLWRIHTYMHTRSVGRFYRCMEVETMWRGGKKQETQTDGCKAVTFLFLFFKCVFSTLQTCPPPFQSLCVGQLGHRGTGASCASALLRNGASAHLVALTDTGSLVKPPCPPSSVPKLPPCICIHTPAAIPQAALSLSSK